MKRRDTVFGRREFLLASGTLALAGTFGNTSAHGKAFHIGSATAEFYEIANDGSVTDLAVAARQCVITAEACVDYFTNDLGLVAQDLERCVELDYAVIAVCGAVASLASVASSYLAGIAVTAMEICGACEKECNARKDNQLCVDCAKACRSYIDECDRATITVQYYL